MTDCIGLLAGDASHLQDCVDPAGLALVCSHANRGVAFSQFDLVVAFLNCEFQVGAGNVILKIDKCFAAPVVECDRSGLARHLREWRLLAVTLFDLIDRP